MKKEVFIAILAGLAIGLIITVGIFTANRSLEQQKTKNSPATPTPISSFAPDSANKSLNLTSHENFDLVDKPEITLSGIAWPNAVIALMAENRNVFTTADTEGIFTFTFNLIKGYNEITLIASDPTSQPVTHNLVLTYSTSKIEPL
jgi:hypothetical protein